MCKKVPSSVLHHQHKLFCIKPISRSCTGVELCVLFLVYTDELHRVNSHNTAVRHTWHAICSLEPHCYDILRSSSRVRQLPRKERLRSWEVYDQIYQYKSRNSINPRRRRRTEKNRQSGGQPGSSVLFVCSQRDSQACRRKTQSNQDTDRKQTRTGRYRVWWVSSLAALIV